MAFERGGPPDGLERVRDPPGGGIGNKTPVDGRIAALWLPGCIGQLVIVDDMELLEVFRSPFVDSGDEIRGGCRDDGEGQEIEGDGAADDLVLWLCERVRGLPLSGNCDFSVGEEPPMDEGADDRFDTRSDAIFCSSMFA